MLLSGDFWPYRLGVRTPGFHPGNRGSNPRGATMIFLLEIISCLDFEDF